MTDRKTTWRRHYMAAIAMARNLKIGHSAMARAAYNLT